MIDAAREAITTKPETDMKSQNAMTAHQYEPPNKSSVSGGLIRGKSVEK